MLGLGHGATRHHRARRVYGAMDQRQAAEPSDIGLRKPEKSLLAEGKSSLPETAELCLQTQPRTRRVPLAHWPFDWCLSHSQYPRFSVSSRPQQFHRLRREECGHQTNRNRTEEDPGLSVP